MKALYAVITSLLVSPALAADAEHEHHNPPAEADKDFSPLVQKVRKATGRFRDINVALAEGYVPGTPCVSGPNSGAMGVHLIKAELLTKEVDAETPEALIYEPSPDGRMRLVGVEIITFASDWVNEVPVLDGHLLALRRRAKPLWHPGLLRDPCLGLAEQSRRNVRGLESARLLRRAAPALVPSAGCRRAARRGRPCAFN